MTELFKKRMMLLFNIENVEMFRNIISDISNFSQYGFSIRNLFRGVLSQGFQAIVVYRFFSWLRRHGIPGQPLRFVIERFIEITTGISIPAECIIDKGLRIHHFGGVILHPSVKIGENCVLYHGVTIGDRGGRGNAARIGKNVMIGAGAVIIGEITIGDNCRIGANSVVNVDVPDGATVYGNPCIICIKDEQSDVVNPRCN